MTDEGRVAQPAVQSDAEPAQFVGWHALGSVQLETVKCPACGAVYPNDDNAAELPACPSCGTRDTWEARQDPAFRTLIEEIDGCPSLAGLALLGKRLYALRLSHDQAGVAWSHYQIRKARLESAVRLGPVARGLLAQVEHAESRSLPRLGARLYRLQRALTSSGTPAVSPAEWRRIWHMYQSRKVARPL